MIFKFKPESHLNSRLDAQAVGERLGHLEQTNNGVTAEIVVADAVSPQSPLHNGFEWDDTEAATQHRLNQARKILRSIVTVEVTVSKPSAPQIVRAYLTVQQDNETKYLATSTVMKEPELRDQVLARARKEAKEWRDRYRDLKELAKVFEVIDAVIGMAA